MVENMDKEELKEYSWIFIEYMKDKSRNKVYSQIDIMEVCKVNIAKAIEISEFLVEMNLCKFRKDAN